MGGKRKMLTQTRRKLLGKEMMDAIMAGRFTLNNQPLEAVLDGINEGIQEGRYPIEVDLPTLLKIWAGEPVPTEAPAAEPEQPAPTNHGTVDQIQNGHVPSGMQAQGGPPWSESESAQAVMQAATTYPQVQPQEPHAVIQQPAQDPQYLAWLATQPQLQQASPLPAAAGVAPGQVVQQPAAAMTLEQAQAAMSAVASTVIAEPPKEEPTQVDITPVAQWLQLAKEAQAKIDATKDILAQAKDNVAAYLDQQGGPDKSKLAMLNGRPVMRRTYVRKKVFDKSGFFKAHPEMDESAYTDHTAFYKTELL